MSLTRCFIYLLLIWERTCRRGIFRRERDERERETQCRGDKVKSGEMKQKRKTFFEGEYVGGKKDRKKF